MEIEGEEECEGGAAVAVREEAEDERVEEDRTVRDGMDAELKLRANQLYRGGESVS